MVHIKIYPSKHKIELINESKFDSDLNIPLAYVNLDYTKYKIDRIINDDFLKSDINKNISMIPILPNEKVDPNTLVFNKFEEVVNTENIYKKKNNDYYLTPPYEFIPYNFSYEVIVKKNMTYKTSSKYNINVSCIDDQDSLDLSKRLTQLFTTPQDRQLVPPNISFNFNKNNVSVLTEDMENSDFIFMETFDGQYLDADKTDNANIDKFLEEHINVWVGCDEHYYYKYRNDDLGYLTFTDVGAFKEFELKRSLLSTNRYITSNVYFNLNRNIYLNQEGKNIYNLFTSQLSPVLIVEHIGKGFEIISHNDVLKDPYAHKDLIYEVMMYVYLLSYKKSSRIEEWITYNVPNYEVSNNNLYVKNNFSSHITLNQLLDLSTGDYSIYRIDFYNNNSDIPIPENESTKHPSIDCIDILNNRLIFKLTETDDCIYTEIDKPINWISIYKDGKIYYLDKLYYYIESDITNKFFAIENNDDLLVKLYPFKSSKYNLNIKTDLTLTIEGIKTLVNDVKRSITENFIIYIENEILNYSIASEYEDDINRVKLAEIKISQDIDNTYISDMRQLGGGLPSDVKDDYNMLDIGHINGRPYRKSNTLIVKMPKKYKQYKDKITEAINKYKVGEDYLVLFFEDEE